MSRSPSPFRAGFGKVPPMLAGRDGIISAFRDSIEIGSWSAERATLIRGFRGVGKTVMLETLRRVAEDAGWLTLDETASAGFLPRLTVKLRRAIAEQRPGPHTRIKAVSVAPVGSIELERIDEGDPEPSFDDLLEHLSASLEPDGGIMFTLDEVNESTIDEFRALAAAVQRAISRDLEIAFVAAGLHSDIAAILRDGTSTFLRRAEQENLDLLDWESTCAAIRTPIRDHGRTISDEAVDYAARASQGYPFLTQLIGDLAWKAHANTREISLADVRSAARQSRRRMGASIHEPALSSLTALERTVLAAMAHDDHASIVGEIRDRVGGLSKQHFNNVRTRLIDAGIVYASARGELDFALPYMRDYLREHTVTDAMGMTSADIAKARAAFPPPPADL